MVADGENIKKTVKICSNRNMNMSLQYKKYPYFSEKKNWS